MTSVAANINHDGLEDSEEQASSDVDSESENSDEQDYQTIIRHAPSPPPVESSLRRAIESAPITELRGLLSYLVQNDDFARDAVDRRLTTPIAGATGKRKAFETCVNCGVDYQITENNSGDCIYHPGHKQADRGDDVWADHDSQCHGSPSEFKDDPDMQDGFERGCCEQRGDAAGCIVTRHAYFRNNRRANAAVR